MLSLCHLISTEHPLIDLASPDRWPLSVPVVGYHDRTNRCGKTHLTVSGPLPLRLHGMLDCLGAEQHFAWIAPCL